VNNTPATERFISELDLCVQKLTPYLLKEQYVQRFNPLDIQEAATMYVASGGKRLRPAILLWSCGAVGGDPDKALPAAAAVEIFHTWTLVHDDIIDRDDLRRGGESVHVRFRDRSLKEYGLSVEDAEHYGKSVAILAGDVQHGWNVSMLTELTKKHGLPAEVTLQIIRELNDRTLNGLIEGELLDLQYTRLPVGEPSLPEINDMLRKKTGELYRFCAWGGSIIGLGKYEPENPYVQSLSEFALDCGTAFQLQDDILGVVGDSSVTGKPVGNDLREGKRTMILHTAWERANESQRILMAATVGNGDASAEEISVVRNLIQELGAIDHARDVAMKNVHRALPHLDKIPASKWRDLLASWAEFMIERQM